MTKSKRTTPARDVFIPDNQAVTPRLKIVLETGDSCLLPPILRYWSRDELLLLRRDLRQYFRAGSRQLQEHWEQQFQPARLLDAAHAAELGRRYRRMRANLAQACIEIEDEIERAIETAKAREARA